jgi:hypothetical protein
MEIPSWLIGGTAPQWGVFIVVLLAFLRLVIPYRQQNITTMENICKALQTDVNSLRERLDECEARCQTRDETILGMKKQSVTQQISFVRVLLNALGQDNPELRHMLSSLENLEKSMAGEPIFLGKKQ